MCCPLTELWDQYDRYRRDITCSIVDGSDYVLLFLLLVVTLVFIVSLWVVY